MNHLPIWAYYAAAAVVTLLSLIWRRLNTYRRNS